MFQQSPEEYRDGIDEIRRYTTEFRTLRALESAEQVEAMAYFILTVHGSPGKAWLQSPFRRIGPLEAANFLGTTAVDLDWQGAA